MKIVRTSVLTGIDHTMDLDVTEEQLLSWQQGTLIQRAMPQLTPDQREFLVTGTTAEEWNETFAETEDSDPLADWLR